MKGKARNFLSIAGPHMGVAKIPHCFNGKICHLVNYGVRDVVYKSFFQHHIGPAGYFRDADHLDEYKEGSVFLA
jgi:palmitoyl-protein thioesterase